MGMSRVSRGTSKFFPRGSFIAILLIFWTQTVVNAGPVPPDPGSDRSCRDRGGEQFLDLPSFFKHKLVPVLGRIPAEKSGSPLPVPAAHSSMHRSLSFSVNEDLKRRSIKRTGYADRLLDSWRSGSPESLERLFQSLENHMNSADLPQSECSEKDILCLGLEKRSVSYCSDEDVYRLFESFLAVELLNQPKLNEKISGIFKKIFEGMKKIQTDRGSGTWFDEAVEEWSKNLDPTSVLPVAQKENIFDLAYALSANPRPVLQIDFLLYNAKRLDNVGIPEKVRRARQDFYVGTLKPVRGDRKDNFNGVLRTQYGIMNFDVSELEAPEGTSPWQHWGRDTCKITPDSSPYNRNATRLRLPIACGVSGSSTLVYWSIWASKADLDPNEMRLITVAIFSALCADGGHTLQEVLSAAKFNHSHVDAALKAKESWTQQISAASVHSLGAVTEGLSGDGEPKKSEVFGAYYDGFFSHLKEPAFWEARKAAQSRLMKYLAKPEACRGKREH